MTQIIFESASPQELTLNQGSVNLSLVKGDNNIGLVRPDTQTQLVNGLNNLTVINNNQTSVNLDTKIANINLSKSDLDINLSTQENIISLDTINSSYNLAAGQNQVQLGLDASVFVSRNYTIVLDANCLPTDIVGNCVYERDEPLSGIYQVTTVDPTDWNKMPAIAVIISKSTLVDCKIQLFGPLVNVFSGFNNNKMLFIDYDGSLVEIPPLPLVNGFVFIQSMGVTVGSSIVLINPGSSITKRIG